MKIGLAQINPKVGDIQGNTTKILGCIEKLSTADIVVFPELCVTGYPPEDLLFNKDFIAESQVAVAKIAKAVNSHQAVIIGCPEHTNGELYNAAFVINNGHIIGTHRKVFLPNYDVFDEMRYFSSGQTGTIIRFVNHTVGIIVCEDLWRPDGPAQWEASQGAQTIISINASPFEHGKMESRLNLIRHMAKTSKVSIVYLNMVGGQDELLFDGASVVVSDDGDIQAVMPSFEESLSLVNVPASSGNDILHNDSSFLANESNSIVHCFDVPMETSDEKPISDLVEAPIDSIANIYKGLVMGIKDYVTKQGFKGVIVPVSGGIDSALVATMSVDALGADRVKLIYLPTRFNSPDSLEDAKKLSDNLDSPLMVLSIDSIFETFDNTLRNELHKESFDIADENLQARIRANIVFYISNATGYLVLSCSNKSEAAVGYGTIYGDMAGGFAPIKDVLKTQVYQLARYRNDLNPVIPERILSRAPSAELNVDQKDQDVLPPYDILDAFINDYMVSNIPIENLTQRYGNEVVSKILRMIKGSEFKRKQAPVGPKISPRSFGKGWRMPIVNGFMPKENTLGD
ncbi:NAD+ synthase [Coprothermobacter platensis]|uniref:NAD+ synthase n=1 Tax=Coprothermobacter platensis TaxID=108819 RepID=UPI00037A57EB|nr:NAD+ synthase [Coprothermobacter platensis]